MRFKIGCLFSILFGGSMFGQNETAVLAGPVLDPSGSGIPHAQVRLTETSNGAVRTVVSSTDGFYRFDLLAPGNYSIHATVEGFKTFEDSSLHLDVARP